MPVKISTVRLFKLGLQPLLIMSEASEKFGMVTIYGYLVWPERAEGRLDIERLIEVSARFNGSPASDPDQEHALNSMRLAAHEGALHRAAKLVQSHTNLTDEMTVDLVDVEKLRAWRALGLFPGIENYQVLDSTAAKLLMTLDQPYGFEVR